MKKTAERLVGGCRDDEDAGRKAVKKTKNKTTKQKQLRSMIPVFPVSTMIFADSHFVFIMLWNKIIFFPPTDDILPARLLLIVKSVSLFVFFVDFC